MHTLVLGGGSPAPHAGAKKSGEVRAPTRLNAGVSLTGNARYRSRFITAAQTPPFMSDVCSFTFKSTLPSISISERQSNFGITL
ncbi:hypothetical protein [Treponema endosymbiont of Eucomonympha sp.]|uniref:hypothetical protein n=1 Tax=Treponema endosymbiont of Eucomonympha sp. TaxID=1580831 RepID=UPI00164FC216|nr:hypothetical protein [Treponema endosymbiont of Eucomonympha sp.]